MHILDDDNTMRTVSETGAEVGSGGEVAIPMNELLLFTNQQEGTADILQAFVKTYCDEKLIQFLKTASPAQAKNYV